MLKATSQGHGHYLQTLPDVGATKVSSFRHCGRLFEGLIVSNWLKLEQQRIQWVKFHQEELRNGRYENMIAAVAQGQRDAGSTGCRVILPSTFVGGPRYMLEQYLDAMAIVARES